MGQRVKEVRGSEGPAVIVGIAARAATRKRAHFGLVSDLEGSIYAGLEALTGKLLAREWQRDDGAMLKIGRCLVDANWGTSTDVVYQFCRQSPHAAVLFPSHGRYVGASSTPFAEYKKKQGDRVGLNWRIPNVRGTRCARRPGRPNPWSSSNRR